jgi:hypothetical protein
VPSSRRHNTRHNEARALRAWQSEARNH